MGEAKIRECLKCDEKFSSKGPGDRLCPKCKPRGQAIFGLVDAPYKEHRLTGKVFAKGGRP